MIKTIEKEIGGLKFYIQQFAARKGVKLERKTLLLLLPVLNTAKSSNDQEDLKKKIKKIDDQNNFKAGLNFIDALKDILQNMSEEDFMKYILEIISDTSVEFVNDFSEKNVNSSGKLTNLNDVNIFDNIFAGKYYILYELIFEIMRANNFAFLEVLGGGLEGKILI